MHLRSCFSWLLACGLVATTFLPVAAAQSVDETINRARAYLGKEADLNKVQALEFTGRITVNEGKEAPIRLIFRRPMHQRIEVTLREEESGQDYVDVTALADLEGWRRLSRMDDPAAFRLQLLASDAVARFRAGTWETLNFYRGIEAIGGRVVDRGRETLGGVDCVKLEFVHPGGASFVRYFERSTGRLVMTVDDSGREIREEGEIREAGLRFPKKQTTKQGDRVITVTFDSVKVNGTYGPELFSVPSHF